MIFSIVQRAFLRQILSVFSAVIFVLLAIILGFRLSKLLTTAVEGTISLSAVWKLIAMQAVNIGVVLMPTALIVAMMMTLSRCYQSQEITAIFAAGRGRLTIARFLFLPSFLIAATVLLLNLFLLPETYRQVSLLRSQAEQEAGFAMMTADSFRSISRNLAIHTGAGEDGGFRDFFIYQKSKNKPEQAVTFADFGKVQEENSEQFLLIDKAIRVSFSDFKDSAEDFYKSATYVQFDEGKLHLPSADSANADARLRNVRSFELDNSAAARAELQKRINPALALLIFSFALPLIAHTRPRSNPQRLLPAFLLFALYLNALDWAVKAAAKEKISLFVSGFAIHGLVLVLIVFFWFLAYRRGQP